MAVVANAPRMKGTVPTCKGRCRQRLAPPRSSTVLAVEQPMLAQVLVAPVALTFACLSSAEHLSLLSAGRALEGVMACLQPRDSAPLGRATERGVRRVSDAGCRGRDRRASARPRALPRRMPPSTSARSAVV